MPDRGLPLSLWGIWWNAILLLRPAFSRLRTFMWFVTAVAGLTVRLELLGVTSIVRALNLRPRLYSLPPSLSGTRLGPGCEPFALASRHQNLSSQTHCAKHFLNFSWLPQKPILSRNSSPIGRTRKICGFSAWLRDQKDGLLRTLDGMRARDLRMALAMQR